MRGRRRYGIGVAALSAAAVLAATAPDVAASGRRVSLGAAIRLRPADPQACPALSEPEIAATSVATYVTYNDTNYHACAGSRNGANRITGLQILRPGSAAPRHVPLPATPALMGDGDVAADGGSGAYLSTLVERDGRIAIDVYHVTSAGRLRRLRSPNEGLSGSADKEFLAVDTSARSRYRRSVYVVWDDATENNVLLSGYRNGRWSEPVVVAARQQGLPDVAVGPAGEVAVAYETGDGVYVRISRDGGRSLGPPRKVFNGGEPGRNEASCLLQSTIGLRQRTYKSARVTFDRAGGLHVVAALGDATFSGRIPPDPRKPIAPTTGRGVVMHAAGVAGTGRFTVRTVAPTQSPQWAPAMASLPGGGVAVVWLELVDPVHGQYVAKAAVSDSRHAFGSPVQLSTAVAPIPPVVEAYGMSVCYGIGDYIGVAPTGDGAIAVWPEPRPNDNPQNTEIVVRALTVSTARR